MNIKLNATFSCPTGVTRHGLTYTTLSCICSKEHLHLLSPLSNKNFYVDIVVEQEMFRLRTTQYKPIIPYLKLY
jgi:hypothetical protein